jgi:hypothetical protein
MTEIALKDDVKSVRSDTPARAVLKTIEARDDIRRTAEKHGITPHLVELIQNHLPSTIRPGLKKSDIAFYLNRLIVAGKLKRGAGNSLTLR